jgi:hypothetical protein
MVAAANRFLSKLFIPMRFFRELDPFASHVAVAALAIATWVFLIVPL